MQIQQKQQLNGCKCTSVSGHKRETIPKILRFQHLTFWIVFCNTSSQRLMKNMTKIMNLLQQQCKVRLIDICESQIMSILYRTVDFSKGVELCQIVKLAYCSFVTNCRWGVQENAPRENYTDWVKNQTKKNRLGSFNEDVLFQEGGRV